MHYVTSFIGLRQSEIDTVFGNHEVTILSFRRRVEELDSTDLCMCLYPSAGIR